MPIIFLEHGFRNGFKRNRFHLLLAAVALFTNLVLSTAIKTEIPQKFSTRGKFSQSIPLNENSTGGAAHDFSGGSCHGSDSSIVPARKSALGNSMPGSACEVFCAVQVRDFERRNSFYTSRMERTTDDAKVDSNTKAK